MQIAEFREIVRKCITRANQTQGNLAASLGIVPQHLSDLLNGKKLLNVNHVRGIIKFLAKEYGITTSKEAEDLLDLAGFKPAIFSSDEWNAPPLKELLPANSIDYPNYALPATPTSLVGPTSNRNIITVASPNPEVALKAVQQIISKSTVKLEATVQNLDTLLQSNTQELQTSQTELKELKHLIQAQTQRLGELETQINLIKPTSLTTPLELTPVLQPSVELSITTSDIERLLTNIQKLDEKYNNLLTEFSRYSNQQIIDFLEAFALYIENAAELKTFLQNFKNDLEQPSANTPQTPLEGEISRPQPAKTPNPLVKTLQKNWLLIVSLLILVLAVSIVFLANLGAANPSSSQTIITGTAKPNVTTAPTILTTTAALNSSFKVEEIQNSAKKFELGINDVSYSPDKQFLAHANGDNKIRIHAVGSDELPTDAIVATLEEHTDHVWAAKFSPDNKTLISSSKDKTIKVWPRDSNGVPLVKSATTITTGLSLWLISGNSKGDLITSPGVDNTVVLWNRATGQLVQRFRGHVNPVWQTLFIPNSTLIASSSADKTIKIWNATTDIMVKELLGHTDEVNSLLARPDGSLVFSGSVDKTIRVWSVASGKELMNLTGHNAPVDALAISPDGTILASGDRNGVIKLWDVKTGANLATLTKHTSPILTLAFSPSGSVLVSGSDGSEATMRFWKITK